MLKNLRKSEKGFTLIELLIVVAIIGILAAIAIPQFAAYRMRAFNGAAQADLKNARTAQEALFADFQTYGKTEPTAVLPGAGGGGAGALVVGPMTAGTAANAGSVLTGGRNVDGLAVGVGSGVSNGVSFVSDVPAAPAAPPFGNPTFTMYTKHTQGSRVFVTETEGTAIWFVEDEAGWVGQALAVGGTPATVPVATTAQDIDGATAGGGTPIANWTAL